MKLNIIFATMALMCHIALVRSTPTCNGQVYDPALYTCTINDQGQQVLCPTGSSSCGNACYNPNQYCCQNGGLKQASQCSSQPTTSSGPLTCNGQLYNPTLYDCPINDQGKQVLCPKGHSACGSSCYLASQYCCQNGGLKPAGQCSSQPSCNGQVYNPATYDCPTNDQGTSVLCPKGYSACGSGCYLPSQYCCQNGGLRQAGQCSNGGSQTCSDGETYDPSTSSCCAAIAAPSFKVCPNGQHCCGNILNGTDYFGPGSLYTACYDPTKYKCCFGGTSAFLNPSTIELISYQIPPGVIRACQV